MRKSKKIVLFLLLVFTMGVSVACTGSTDTTTNPSDNKFDNQEAAKKEKGWNSETN